MSRRVSFCIPAAFRTIVVNDPLSSLMPAARDVNQKILANESAFKVGLVKGRIVLVHFLRSLPGKKFANRDSISISSVGCKHYIPSKPLLNNPFDSSPACQSYRCVAFINSLLLASLAIFVWIEEFFSGFLKDQVVDFAGRITPFLQVSFEADN